MFEHGFYFEVVFAEGFGQGFDDVLFGVVIYLVVDKKAVEFAADEPGHFFLGKDHIEHFVKFLLTVFSFPAFNKGVAIKGGKLFVAFIVASCLLMSNIKYGMNLRYTNMWDMPLRFLAFGQVVALAERAKVYRTLILCGSISILCAIELRQYFILFVQYPLYELVPEGLLRAVAESIQAGI